MTHYLDHLQNRISTALRQLPGATALYLFGSSADPATRDDYSDLDLHLITVDFARSQLNFFASLELVGPVDIAFSLQDSPNEFAYSIAFSEESPFHKVDIGVSTPGSSSILAKAHPILLLWVQPPFQTREVWGSKGVYSPARGSAAYFLIGELMSAVRYVKCRKRQRHLMSWRFLSAKVNALLAAVWWQQHGGDVPEKLSTWDLARLDQMLPERDRLEWIKIVDCQDPAAMDRSMCEITQRIVDILLPYLNGEDARAVRLADHYLKFMRLMLQ